MKKSLVKGFFMIVVMAGALGICFFGYRVNANRVKEQKIAYAESMTDISEETLNDLASDIATLYTDSSKQFLTSETTEEAVVALEGKVNEVQATAEDFELDGTSLNSSLKKLNQKKEQQLLELEGIRQQLKLEQKITGLFTAETLSWQPATDDVTITDDLTTDDIVKLQNQVNDMGAESWRNAANHYLNAANEQLKQVADIQATFDSYIKDGALTADVDYNNYYTLESQINEVKNETLRNDLHQQLDQLNTLLQGTASQETTEDTTEVVEDTVVE